MGQFDHVVVVGYGRSAVAKQEKKGRPAECGASGDHGRPHP